MKKIFLAALMAMSLCSYSYAQDDDDDEYEEDSPRAVAESTAPAKSTSASKASKSESGDAFMGVWLHAISLFPDDKQMQLNYSLAAAALKNTIPGDFNLSTEEEILDVMEGHHNISTLYKTIE